MKEETYVFQDKAQRSHFIATIQGMYVSPSQPVENNWCLWRILGCVDGLWRFVDKSKLILINSLSACLYICIYIVYISCTCVYVCIYVYIISCTRDDE